MRTRRVLAFTNGTLHCLACGFLPGDDYDGDTCPVCRGHGPARVARIAAGNALPWLHEASNAIVRVAVGSDKRQLESAVHTERILLDHNFDPFEQPCPALNNRNALVHKLQNTHLVLAIVDPRDHTATNNMIGTLGETRLRVHAPILPVLYAPPLPDGTDDTIPSDVVIVRGNLLGGAAHQPPVLATTARDRNALRALINAYLPEIDALLARLQEHGMQTNDILHLATASTPT